MVREGRRKRGERGGKAAKGYRDATGGGNDEGEVLGVQEMVREGRKK